jgi:hypothetical protein
MSNTNSYAAVYDAVGLDPTLREIAMGRIPIPLMRVWTPFACYGFPPALIPTWSNGNSMYYVGLWKHWFVPRQATFVQCLLEEDCRVYEIARNPAQLLHVLGLEILCACEGDRGELEEFARRCGGSIDVVGLEQIAWQTGDDPVGLLGLPLFQDDPPLSMCGDAVDYRGDFPDPRDEANSRRFQESCTLEVPDAFVKAIVSSPWSFEFPPWYREQDVQGLFYELLGSGNTKDAWLVLNCHGWDYPSAKQALSDLSRRAGDSSFSTVADAWRSLDHQVGGGY